MKRSPRRSWGLPANRADQTQLRTGLYDIARRECAVPKNQLLAHARFYEGALEDALDAKARIESVSNSFRNAVECLPGAWG